MARTTLSKVGKYAIIREINRGSMGTVYLGHDPFADRRVAIKIAHVEQLKDEESGAQFRKMFFNEAHTAGLLTHPNIVSIHDAGVDGQHCYIVMEYVEGGATLKSACKPEGLLPIERVVEVIFKCAKALDYAHRQGVIHRDIKPGNILVTSTHDVKIADFSVAYLNRLDSDHTLVLGVAGSPRYMSPEQISDQTLTPQTDLFSLGVITYEMLTGKNPFYADSFPRLIQRIMTEDPPPLRQYREDIPEILEKIVRKALAKRPSDRYASAADLAADLSKASDRTLELAAQEIDSEVLFNSVKGLAFFQDFNGWESELRELVEAGNYIGAEAGKQIIVEGELDDSFYVILEGEASVRKGNRELSMLKQGDCIGEIGYLMRTKRTASIYAKTPLVLLKLNSTVMSRTSKDCQIRFLRAFLRTVLMRLTATIERLAQ
ncbi:MAG: protein kinase domain-containing protein [Chromatiales bacterium]